MLNVGCSHLLVRLSGVGSLGRMKKRVQLPRRSFLKGLGLAVPVAMTGPGLAFAQDNAGSATPSGAAKTSVKELAADLVIIGGGLGGCAAALAAARSGLRVIMTEETDWIGGQLTAQAVPPDENEWIETFGGTHSYLNLRQQIRDYYLRYFPHGPSAGQALSESGQRLGLAAVPRTARFAGGAATAPGALR